MKPARTLLLSCLLLQAFILLAQQQDTVKATGKIKMQEKAKSDSIDTLTGKAKSLGREAGREIRSTLKQEVQAIQPDTLPRSEDVKKTAQERAGKMLEQKAANLQYDSDRPEDAPWKRNNSRKTTSITWGLPSVPGKDDLPSVEDKAAQYKDRITDLKPDVSSEQRLRSEMLKAGSSDRVDKARHQADSLLEMKDKVASTDLRDLSGTKKVYSEKYIRKMYDSLGIHKADSLFKTASSLTQAKTSKEELLSRINTPLREQAGKAGLGFDEKSQSLKMDDAEKLQGLPGEYGKADLALLQLPGDVLSELAPLTGSLTDSKYMPLIDSMRQVAMKAKGYKLDERQMTEEVKRTAMEKKLGLMDKSYFEGILGFVNDTTFSIVQVSPVGLSFYR